MPAQDASDGRRPDRGGLLVFSPPIVSRYATTATRWVVPDGPPAIYVKQKGDPMTATETLPTLLRIDELTDHLGTTSGHVRWFVTERRVPYLKVGGYVDST